MCGSTTRQSIVNLEINRGYIQDINQNIYDEKIIKTETVLKSRVYYFSIVYNRKFEMIVNRNSSIVPMTREI